MMRAAKGCSLLLSLKSGQAYPKGYEKPAQFSENPSIVPLCAAIGTRLLTIPSPRQSGTLLWEKDMRHFAVLRRYICDFGSRQDGNITIFSVYMALLVLIVSGAAVDIMRFEASRAVMQTTLDRAVLAAADLDQEQAPVAVVNDYLAKAGMSEVVTSVHIDQGLNYRTVTAEGLGWLDTIFLRLSGYDKLAPPALSVAEEKISNVEISLVLDVSGSMGSNYRIQNLRTAAKEFIDTVVKPYEEGSGLTTVSVVPYNATVNLGPSLAAHWTFDDLHDHSYCAIFPDNSFFATEILPTQELERLAHFDLYSSSESSTEISSPWCKTGEDSAVIVHSSDASRLKNHVNSLGANGNTAIDLGMKWGVALLDPAARPVVSALVEDGLVLPQAADRPAEYSNPEAIKFVVVMTDGQNTTEYDLKWHHKYGFSDVWIDDRGTSSKSDDRFSLLVRDQSGSSNDVYFWHRYEGSSWNYRYRNTPDGGANARRMTNVELFARFGTKAVARKLYRKPYYDNWISSSRYNDVYYAYEAIVGAGSADDRLSNICNAAKQAGIVVFAVAFEAPSAGQAALKDCASSAAHYFDVEGVEIAETFHAIARQINSLRLIQ